MTFLTALEVVQPCPDLLSGEDIAALRTFYKKGGAPAASGIYFLWKGETLLYIGLSKNLNQRLWSHFVKRVDDPPNAIWFDHFSAIEAPERWLKDIERQYIRRHRPPRNIKDNW